MNMIHLDDPQRDGLIEFEHAKRRKCCCFLGATASGERGQSNVEYGL